MKELRWLGEEPKSQGFFFCFVYFFYIMCFVLINYWEQRLSAVLTMAKKKPDPVVLSTHAPGKKPLIRVSLVRDQPHSSHAKSEIPL